MPNIADRDSSENDEPFMEGGSSKGPKSDISGGRSAYSANRSRAPSYAPSAAGKSDNRSDNTQLIKGGGRGGTRRNARDYQKMEISTGRIICLSITPRCCRTKC